PPPAICVLPMIVPSVLLFHERSPLEAPPDAVPSPHRRSSANRLRARAGCCEAFLLPCGREQSIRLRGARPAVQIQSVGLLSLLLFHADQLNTGRGLQPLSFEKWI